ncbi:hypothetical protein UFOVP84_74 [uncultured Caudovirales phage]|uniref:Uncharacterized protein n=1 Tax=uncultured Caudovirales phage TaxID=2100421 RepID=A0A6J5L1M6_9CAUD|nr:hypothetical protein UFOVP84_74 [uncultured Caudovirales phage]
MIEYKELTEEECEIFWNNRLGLDAMIRLCHKAGFEACLEQLKGTVVEKENNC